MSSVQYSGSAPAIKKKKHMGFAERAEAKMKENEEKETTKNDAMLI